MNTKLSEHFTEEQPASIVGDFHIVREAGRGGCGVVYEAVQISLDRRVALKVLPHLNAQDKRKLQRFKKEAQAAAHLHHPNIVPVFAVGCVGTTHYYAMQFIDGQDLAQVIRRLRGPMNDAVSTRQPCATAPLPETLVLDAAVESPEPDDSLASAKSESVLSLDRRVSDRAYFREMARIGIQAAEALEHAHQLGVVHRDIKPGNLILDEHGHLWVTDFGLAQFANDIELTASGDLIGTLCYMSPEQAQARRSLVDQRTDIYSLGATLYELATLEPAFAGSDRRELLHKIIWEEPRPPRRVNPAIPADLETILLKAMAKEPSQRYATAQELADDFDRFLEDKPIRARRETILQKTAKWSRRHRAVVLTSAFTGVAGLAACALLFWQGQVLTEKQRQRAEAHSELARQALDEMYTQAQKWLYSEPWVAPDQEKFLRRALAFYQELAQEPAQTAAERCQVAEAYHRMAEIQLRLWDVPPAESAIDQAITMLNQLLIAGDPALDRRELSRCQITQGIILQRLGREKKAIGVLESACADLQKLRNADGDSAEDRRLLAQCQYELGALLAQNPQRHVEADAALTSAQTLFQELAGKEPANPDYLNLLASVSAFRGKVLLSAGLPRDAEQTLRQSISRLDKLAADSMLQPDFRQDLAQAQSDLGYLLTETNRLKEAKVAYGKALEIYEKLAQTFPHVARYQGYLGSTQGALVSLLHRQGDLAGARTMAADAIHHQHVALNANPQQWDFRISLQKLNGKLARVLLDLGDHKAASVAADEVADIIPGCPIGGTNAMILFASFVKIAENDARLTPEQRSALVERYRAREKELRERVLPICGYLPNVQNDFAWYLATFPDVRFRDVQRAAELAEAVVARAANVPAHWNTLGVARYRKGDWRGALAALTRSAELAAGREAADFFFLAMAHWRLDEKQAARECFERACQIMRKSETASEELQRFHAEAVVTLQLGGEFPL